MTRHPSRESGDGAMRVGLAWVSLSSTVAFLPVERRGNGYLYAKVHPAVVLNDCACGARAGELCGGRFHCHADRKVAFYARQRQAGKT